MTQQSGQGAASSDPHPADRHAHEGIVLPADGSEPLMPGTAGDQTAPAGGSPWGQPWGPAPAEPQPGAGQAWGTADGPVDGSAPAPQQQAYQPAPPQQAYPQQGYPQQGYQQQTYDQQNYQQQQSYQQPQNHPPQQTYGASAPLPPSEGAPQPPYQAAQQPADASYGAPHAGQPADGSYAAQPGQLPPAAQAGQLPPAEQPGQLPPAAQAGQLPPAVSGMPLPPAGPLPAGDADATQYIPPVAPGALPPEAPAGDATQFLGRGPMPGAPMPGAPMPGAPMPAAGSDNEATQYIAPVPAEPGAAPFGIRPGTPGERPPHAEFDSLFRTEQPESDGPASTQQMPRFEPPQPAAHGQGNGDGGGRAARRAAAAAPASRGGGRTGSKVPIFVAAGVVIALIGVGAGALLSGGGDEKKDSPKTVSDSAPSDEKPSPSVDPAKEQAVALDKLLADSNNSRDSVIAAVRNVGKCTNLSQSATDLRNAAKQRNGLVTRLSALSVDKLPTSAQLTTSLTKAWKASAAADNHYAAWAGQVGGKKGCKKGHPRTTPQAAAANKSSGEATTAKTQAAGLWNTIAKQYGLTTRDRSQL
ncbi:hypothetical protein ACGFSB_26720 [Streptomyces sp. NPDC048441]|uniref:hypothetical protein n=1 Tax=Streptomyces sp. NPDC048441 TaxID=3365552 RepID=UPI00371EC868